jgi:hypothetical protein
MTHMDYFYLKLASRAASCPTASKPATLCSTSRGFPGKTQCARGQERGPGFYVRALEQLHVLLGLDYRQGVLVGVLKNATFSAPICAIPFSVFSPGMP